MTQPVQTEKKDDLKTELQELLSHYQDGWDVLKKSPGDWNDHLSRAEGCEESCVPNTWPTLAAEIFDIIVKHKYGLDTYSNQISIVDSEQMLYLYSTVGMLGGYPHWSIGKSHEMQKDAYDGGQMGLAYEIVINSDPAISYCMTQNTAMMQLLVIAHAAYGHNSFFKGNHLFRQFTHADEIMADMQRLGDDVARYEEKYGLKEVEKIIDAAHALESHGVNRYNKPPKRTPEEEIARRIKIEQMRMENFDPLLDGFITKKFDKAAEIPADMEENLLRFIASDAPHLQAWQRNLISQIAAKSQYFYPQRQTQVMNEGWATFWHHTLMTDLLDLDLIGPGTYIEFLKSHTSVTMQLEPGHPAYSGFNPYALGYAMFKDIRRICEAPTEEDQRWFPSIAGKDWIPTLKEAMENYKDESFILQYLSPKIMRDFHLWSLRDEQRESEYVVTAIHNESGYQALREDLASQYRLADREPQIEVANYNYAGDRSVTLQHTIRNGVPIDQDQAFETLKHFHFLWKHPVILHSVDDKGIIQATVSVPKEAKNGGPKVGQKLTFNG